MPVPTLEGLQQREGALKKKIGDAGDSLEAGRRRDLGKKLRRAQRKRRRFVVEVERKAKAAPKPEADKPAEAKEGEAAGDGVKPWRRTELTRLHRCRVFDVDRMSFEPPDSGQPGSFYRIDAPDWINVIALTADNDVLLLRQYRFGVEGFTLEIPGGMCDPGETPEQAARRELREETGCAAAGWKELGWVHPNPAIQTNRCHTFLATAVHTAGSPQPDTHERFEQVRLPLSEIPGRIASGEITHALVVAAFQLLEVDGTRPEADPT